MPAIVVVGEALIDLLFAPDRPIEARPGGGPFTTSRTLGRLGADVAYVGRLSSDPFGRRLAASLAADGVHLDHAVTTDDPTTLAVAELDVAGDASYRFYIDGTSAPGLVPDDVRPAVLAAGVTAVHVGTLALVMEPIGTTVEATLAALPADVLVMLDPNARPAAVRDLPAFRARVERLVRRADVVKVSDDDLQVLEPEGPPEATIARWLDRGVSVVLRTAGPRPVAIRGPTGTITIDVPAVPVVDTIGAGDAFGGGFLAAWTAARHTRAELHDAAAVADAVRAAIHVAALTCTRAGAEPPTAAEVAASGLVVDRGPVDPAY